MPGSTDFEKLKQTVIACELCPRLREYCTEVARIKRRAFRDWTYWGRPVPGFGPHDARLLIIGLAPAAHGGNRTGRMFTGDRSGDVLYRALYDIGLASRPTSVDIDDGLELYGTRVTSPVHCAPPANKPTPEERDRCSAFLSRELPLLTNAHCVLCLGAFAWDGLLRVLASRWLGLGPEFGVHLALSTASFGAVGYEHDRTRPVIRLWNDTRHVE